MSEKTSRKLVWLQPSWHVWERQRESLWLSIMGSERAVERAGRWAGSSLCPALLARVQALHFLWVQWEGLEVSGERMAWSCVCF